MTADAVPGRVPPPAIDATVLLLRALRVSARAAGTVMTVLANDDRGWTSATFTGVRHRIAITVDRSAAAIAWLDGLGDADLPMRGHLVADLAVVRDGDAVALCALTIETE